jgi:hypothetical protein
VQVTLEASQGMRLADQAAAQDRAGARDATVHASTEVRIPADLREDRQALLDTGIDLVVGYNPRTPDIERYFMQCRGGV